MTEKNDNLCKQAPRLLAGTADGVPGYRYAYQFKKVIKPACFKKMDI